MVEYLYGHFEGFTAAVHNRQRSVSFPGQFLADKAIEEVVLKYSSNCFEMNKLRYQTTYFNHKTHFYSFAIISIVN